MEIITSATIHALPITSNKISDYTNNEHYNEKILSLVIANHKIYINVAIIGGYPIN